MTLSIPYSSIIFGVRGRQKENYGDLKPLAESFERVGTIHPIVLSKRPPTTEKESAVAHEGYVYDLVAGGRRYKALGKLKIETLYHGSILNPEKLGFLFEEDVPEHVRREAELDENIYRLDMVWVDEVMMIADVHNAKRQQAALTGKRWGQAQTAAIMRKGVNVTSVNYALQIAKAIRDGDKEILKSPDITSAMSYLLKQREDAALASLHKKSQAKLAESPLSKTSTSSFLGDINISLGGIPKPGTQKFSIPGLPGLELDADIAGEEKPAGGQPRERAGAASGSASPSRSAAPTPSLPSPDPVIVPLSQMFFLGDSVEGPSPVMQSLPDASFDHIVTDIPYGISMDNLDEKMVADVAAEHDVEQNVGMMPIFLRQSFRLLKPGGFCVFFYDLDHHEKLQTWAADAGFKVQRWPLVACKTSSCRNNAAAYNFTKNFEVAMVLRRDEKTILRKQQPTSYWTGDFRAEQKLYENPFAKPFELWQWIFKAIALPGQTVLDPYCGEMSSCRAAVNCGLTPFGIEKGEKHYHRGLINMQKVYSVVHSNNVKFT